jgi:hypothetical protein
MPTECLPRIHRDFVKLPLTARLLDRLARNPESRCSGFRAAAAESKQFAGTGVRVNIVGPGPVERKCSTALRKRPVS